MREELQGQLNRNTMYSECNFIESMVVSVHFQPNGTVYFVLIVSIFISQLQVANKIQESYIGNYNPFIERKRLNKSSFL